MKRPIKTLALFSGGGGLDLGFSAAGFSLVLTTDNDPYSCRTLELNQGKKRYYDKHPVLVEDISKLTIEQIKNLTNVKENEIDFIIGGPPCQSFSISGLRGGLNDPRGNLIWEYARIVKEVNPKGFLFENVAGLRTIDNGKVFDDLLKVLSFDGKYKITAQTYQVADYGIPQFRNRVIIIGNRIGKDIPPMRQTHSNDPTIGMEPYRTVGEALRYLPEFSANSDMNAHSGRKHSQRIVQRYQKLKYGERDPKTRINKLNPDTPSFAIIVGSNHGGGKGHVHPFEPREVSPRESARMQTFPDWWHFDGSGRHLIRQVGNAVPALFATLIGSHVMKHMFGGKPTSYKEAIKRLDLQYLENDYRFIQPQNTLKRSRMAG